MACSLQIFWGTLGPWDLNNPLWIVRNNELIADDRNNVEKGEHVSLIEIKGDKQPVGQYAGIKSFTQHEIELNTSDSVYLFTDGYADQFGGVKGKKFRYKQFKQLLLAINSSSMEQQHKILNDSFAEWMGDLEQIDDVIIIGSRL